MTFDVTTTNTGPTVVDTRTYNRFSDAAEDVVNGRIYEGIHFRFADTERESRADTWPNGPSATSCGLWTTNDDDDGLDDVCDDHQHNDRAHTGVGAGFKPASTLCGER